MKYCDDTDCPNFQITDDADCSLGFANKLRLPQSIADTYNHNWGYVMPIQCRIKYKRDGTMKPNLKSSREVKQ